MVGLVAGTAARFMYITGPAQVSCHQDMMQSFAYCYGMPHVSHADAAAGGAGPVACAVAGAAAAGAAGCGAGGALGEGAEEGAPLSIWIDQSVVSISFWCWLTAINLPNARLGGAGQVCGCAQASGPVGSAVTSLCSECMCNSFDSAGVFTHSAWVGCARQAGMTQEPEARAGHTAGRVYTPPRVNRADCRPLNLTPAGGQGGEGRCGGGRGVCGASSAGAGHLPAPPAGRLLRGAADPWRARGCRSKTLWCLLALLHSQACAALKVRCRMCDGIELKATADAASVSTCKLLRCSLGSCQRADVAPKSPAFCPAALASLQNASEPELTVQALVIAAAATCSSKYQPTL
jgi:hypothetical protein